MPWLKADVEDRREAVAQESLRYRAEHFPDGHMPPKHDGRQLMSVQSVVTVTNEAPGGVGFGYFFNNTNLLWTNSSIADYYVIAPSSLGGNVITLYLTSTCRAQLGTESLVAYNESSGDPQFWIYDWSLEEQTGQGWEVMFDLPSNPQYLTMRPDEFAITRQMVHVRNGTYYLGFSKGLYNWENQTLLYNFTRGGWDFIYSHSYTTTNLTNNLPTTNGQYYGSWGPIVETFAVYTNVNPVGFDLIRLFQDGNPNPSWLTTSNSYIESNTGGATNWTLLTQAPDTSFSVDYNAGGATGSTNLGTLCVTANTNTASFSLSPSVGTNSSSWIITPNSNHWDKTVVGLPPGAYTITFSNAPGVATPPQQTLTIVTNTITTVQATYGMRPVLQSATRLGLTFSCVWTVQTNFTYQLQDNSDLAQTNWTNWGSAITATNGTLTFTNTISTNSHWFCRLVLIP